MKKRKLIETITERLKADLALYYRAAVAARAEATHEQSKAENKYDTRGLEASYLARRQAKQVAEVEAQKPALKSQETETTPAKDLAMYIQMEQKWSSLGFVIQDGEHFFESQERSK